jgi:hypothetical protein
VEGHGQVELLLGAEERLRDRRIMLPAASTRLITGDPSTSTLPTA